MHCSNSDSSRIDRHKNLTAYRFRCRKILKTRIAWPTPRTKLSPFLRYPTSIYISYCEKLFPLYFFNVFQTLMKHFTLLKIYPYTI